MKNVCYKQGVIMIKKLQDIYEALTVSADICGEEESVKSWNSYLQDEGEDIPDTLEEIENNTLDY